MAMQVGILHPGQMGAAVGAAAARRARVTWCGAGRSEATRHRAEAAGFDEVAGLESLVATSHVILSVCPPHAALDQARAVAALAFSGLYVDANAVSPQTARRVGDEIRAGGGRFVDGGIIGPPARREGTTRLYLAGAEAATVASLFEGSLLEARCLAAEAATGAASALKMCYGAYTKGSAALLVAILALARGSGVEAYLEEEWCRSQPELPERSRRSATSTAPKAWRFAGEMEEIAATFAAAGLPDGFHRAAAELYRRLAAFKNENDVELDELLRTLLSTESPSGCSSPRA